MINIFPQQHAAGDSVKNTLPLSIALDFGKIAVKQQGTLNGFSS
jgi:hypothetical protein